MSGSGHGGARPGAGRPRRWGDDVTVVTAFTLPSGLVDALTAAAEARGVSRSELAATILARSLLRRRKVRT